MEDEPVYTIGVVSKMLGVHPRTLRIYEEEGLISPRRIGGKRYYSESDLHRLRCIRVLLEEGVNIAGIKRLLSLAPCWRVLKCPVKKRELCSWYKIHGRWKMRIAFATEDNRGLEAQVSSHFRIAPFFTFVDLDPDGEVVSVEVKENPFAQVHGPGLVPGFIRDEEADMVVAGGMGMRAAEFMRRVGVEPVVGAQGRVMDVLRAILAGEEFEGSLCSPHDDSRECKKHQAEGEGRRAKD